MTTETDPTWTSDPLVAFHVLDSSGKLLRSGKCPQSLVELQAHEAGEKACCGEHTESATAHAPALFTYAVPRAAAYPSIGDQLDTIWKVLSENPELLPAAASSMLAKIQEVKSSIPKDMLYVATDAGYVQHIPAV